ncbi:MAG: hypothetical protein AB7P99_06920 [Vicinamibacterales bacterium]
MNLIDLKRRVRALEAPVAPSYTGAPIDELTPEIVATMGLAECDAVAAQLAATTYLTPTMTAARMTDTELAAVAGDAWPYVPGRRSADDDEARRFLAAGFMELRRIDERGATWR